MSGLVFGLPGPPGLGDGPGDESGSVLVEFAVALMVFLLLFVGIVDMGYYIHAAMELQEAAAAGAQYGIIPRNQKDTSGMQAAAQAAAPDLNGVTATATDVYRCTPAGAAVTSGASCGDYGTPIMYVQVTTTATVPVVLKWSGIAPSLNLQGFAMYRVPWTP